MRNAHRLRKLLICTLLLSRAKQTQSWHAHIHNQIGLASRISAAHLKPSAMSTQDLPSTLAGDPGNGLELGYGNEDLSHEAA